MRVFMHHLGIHKTWLHHKLAPWPVHRTPLPFNSPLRAAFTMGFYRSTALVLLLLGALKCRAQIEVSAESKDGRQYTDTYFLDWISWRNRRPRFDTKHRSFRICILSFFRNFRNQARQWPADWSTPLLLQRWGGARAGGLCRRDSLDFYIREQSATIGAQSDDHKV